MCVEKLWLVFHINLQCNCQSTYTQICINHVYKEFSDKYQTPIMTCFNEMLLHPTMFYILDHRLICCIDDFLIIEIEIYTAGYI